MFPTRKSGARLAMYLLGLALVALAVAAKAGAETPTPPPGGVAVAIVKDYPSLNWGEKLYYVYQVTNETASTKKVALDFTYGNRIAASSGPYIPRITITLGPHASVKMHFKTTLPPDPGNSTGRLFCLTIFVNGNTGAFTSAWTPGMK